jgi:outer membrane biosynthesis protein TonB
LTAPKPTRTPEPEFSDKARKAIKKQHLKFFNGVSVVSMIVDLDGIPRDLCLQKAAGYGLDAQAEKAAGQYRFEPATRDGKPVPARIAVEINFRLY